MNDIIIKCNTVRMKIPITLVTSRIFIQSIFLELYVINVITKSNSLLNIHFKFLNHFERKIFLIF